MGGMDNFLVPVGQTLAVSGPTLPRMLERHVSGATKGMAEAQEITHLFGARDAKPEAPLLIWGPDGRVPILVFGFGETEAAELQDLAMEAIDQQAEQMKKSGRGLDFDELRAKAGAPRREDADASIREAIQARIDHHKQNPVTDPFRQPNYGELGHVFRGASIAKEGAA